MPVNVIVGGQYGSEGKGKVTAYLAERDCAAAVVRCGGLNSGHTVIVEGKKVVLRHLPAGFQSSECRLLVPNGAYLDLGLLLREMEELGVSEHRVGISPNAMLVEGRHRRFEADLALANRIGSTLSGTGAAVSDRVLRSERVTLARDVPKLRPFLTDVADEVTRMATEGRTVLIEGTQGFGLSLLHSPHFPKVTSRDTIAAGFCSEVGISPRLVTDVTVVFRTYPIRVAGNSGSLLAELSWNEITRRSGAPNRLSEFTSVTNKLRRIGEFDSNLARMALVANMPTSIVLNHIDYVSFADCGKQDFAELSGTSRLFISRIESELGHLISLIGTGPDHTDVISKPAGSRRLAGRRRCACGI